MILQRNALVDSAICEAKAGWTQSKHRHGWRLTGHSSSWIQWSQLRGRGIQGSRIDHHWSFENGILRTSLRWWCILPTIWWYTSDAINCARCKSIYQGEQNAIWHICLLHWINGPDTTDAIWCFWNLCQWQFGVFKITTWIDAKPSWHRIDPRKVQRQFVSSLKFTSKEVER